jgi:hypothetical protein
MKHTHPPKRDPDDPGLCFICGEPVTGVEPGLRHVGETVRTPVVPREYADAQRECVAIVEQALATHILTAAASDEERARVAVAALIEQRYLRTRRAAPPKHPVRN